MADRVDIDKLASVIAEDLAQYDDEVSNLTKSAVAKVTRKTVKKLKEDSPVSKRRRRKHYAEDWTSKTEFESRTNRRNVVHNRQYQLPHLLEDGHETRNGGRTRAQIHIAPAEQEAQKELEEEVKKGIESI